VRENAGGEMALERQSAAVLEGWIDVFETGCSMSGGYLEKGIHILMALGRSTKVISMIKWTRTSRLSTKNCLSQVCLLREDEAAVELLGAVALRQCLDPQLEEGPPIYAPLSIYSRPPMYAPLSF